MKWLNAPARFLFFTGKGGVGKTSLSASIAISLADAGKRVLLVSTDAASNLDEMLGAALSNRPVAVPGVSCTSTDPDLAGSFAAIQRAARSAQDLAIKTNTSIFVSLDGKDVELTAADLIKMRDNETKPSQNVLLKS